MNNAIFCYPFPRRNDDCFILFDGEQVSTEDKSKQDEVNDFLNKIYLQTKNIYGEKVDCDNESESIFKIDKSTFYIKGWIEDKNEKSIYPFVYYVQGVKNRNELKSNLEKIFESYNIVLSDRTNANIDSYINHRIYTSFWQLILLCLFIIFILWIVLFW